MIDCRCTMLLKHSKCSTCDCALVPGDLVRMRRIEGRFGSYVQCGPCAAKELLPLFEAEDRAMRERVRAEDQAQA